MNEKPFTRCPKNPLLTPDDLPVMANAVLNPGVAEVDGEVVLLLRIETKPGTSQIRVARSANGVDKWRIDKRPLLEPDLPEYPYEEWGCEDSRVTQIGPNEWLIAYVAYSTYGPAVALAKTHDFDTVRRMGIVLSPTNKDATVLPQLPSGEWIMLHRPVTGGTEEIWYAVADQDVAHWTSPGILFPVRGGPWWDGLRIGVGAPPILTDRGWLLIYHGVKQMGADPVYRLGLALLDKENPRKTLMRASEWVFAPEKPYERHGQVANVVFTCGAILRGDEVWMYYGAADTVVGLAVAKLSDLLEFVEEHDYLRRVGRVKGMIV
ncbi:MAG TPA: glycosidase [Armatimonadota bacterium]